MVRTADTWLGVYPDNNQVYLNHNPRGRMGQKWFVFFFYIGMKKKNLFKSSFQKPFTK